MRLSILILVLWALCAPGFHLSAQTGKPLADSSQSPGANFFSTVTRSSRGLATIHQAGDRWYLELPDSLLDRDLLVVNRISEAAADGRSGNYGFAGDQISERVIRFVQGPRNRIFIQEVSFTELSRDSTDNGMYRSVARSNVQPLIAAFEIKSRGKDSSSVVLDLTDYLNSDAELFSFNAFYKSTLKLSGLQADRSYIAGVTAFARNIEIRTVKTYAKNAAPSALGASTGAAFGTYALNSSIILLPKDPMRGRNADNRVGYYGTGYTDFDGNPQGIEQTLLITRWRMEPRTEDIAAYLRGELVQPKVPIVYYIDPATPKKWVPYLMQGVQDWQAAFEAAGFKNAIVARLAPSPLQDSTWSMNDALHNVIVYKPSTIANASGPHVHDPRSGEILETHINWYHNVMKLLHHWYMIQAGVIDPRARTMQFSDSLMGQLIRFVSSHEVGHTLGLRHNFGSSSTVPVELLRNKKWVETHGHTPSIMDYARFNYVAQPEDSIGERGIFPRVGDYDKWAIAWGYRWWPEMNSTEEKIKLNNWIVRELEGNPRLWFGTEGDANDPRSQDEDLGDDAMKAGVYGILNLQRVIKLLPEWTITPGDNYQELGEMYDEVVSQYSRYLGHVVKYIGGIETTLKSADQEGPVIGFTSLVRQRSAIAFLHAQLFRTPAWLLDKKITLLTGKGDAAMLLRLQEFVLARLLNGGTLERLLLAESVEPANAYTARVMLGDLRQGIWEELASHRGIDMYRRNLQKLYTEKLITLLVPGSGFAMLPPGATMAGGSTAANKNSDQLSLLKAEAKTLLAEIKKAQPLITDAVTRLHLQDCRERLEAALTPKK